MKAKLILLLLSLASSLFAQTNFDVLSCADRDLTNATIIRSTPAYVVVQFDGGLVKEALTNLPPVLQEKYHYNPTNAAAALATEEAHRLKVIADKIAQQKYLASLRGSNELVQVIYIADAFGQCKISGHGNVYMVGIPSSVNDYLSRYWQLKNGISDAAARAERMARAASRADANAPTAAGGDASYVDAAMAQRTTANNMIENANNAAADVEKMKSDLADMETGLVNSTTVIAYPTGLQYAGLSQWQCVGVSQ